MFDAIRFSGYKSFSADKEVEVPTLEYVNLFIGKNNCGKSSVLDVIGAACQAEYYAQLQTKPAQIILGYRVKEEIVNQVTQYAAINTKRAMHKHIDDLLWLSLTARSGFAAGSIQFERKYSQALNPVIQDNYVNWNSYTEKIPREGNVKYVKIAAERNIIPEKAIDIISLLPDGSGATNVIRNIINNRKYDENLIETKLLTALNKIMGNDAQFESIRVQEISAGDEFGDTVWEVFLQEKGSTRFPLSQSGSGLKTIILVLLNLLVLPEIQTSHTYVYAFEELENNLHPALQRRLYDYIYAYAISNQKYVFLTTHSHIAINMFFSREHTSLYHVIKNACASDVKQIENYLDKVDILNDLDVRASDLLQSNGIIWVEGPSDRIYVKRWLEIFNEDDIHEGRDYQFAYYGGRLLSHYSADEVCDGLINILLVNRNSAIIMDSDKRARNQKINNTKTRIQQEFNTKGLFSWITKGKEIENYLSVNAINRALATQIPEQCGQYDLFPDYISKVYSSFSSKKVPFANTVKDFIDSENILDLEANVKKLSQTIRLWNK